MPDAVCVLGLSDLIRMISRVGLIFMNVLYQGTPRVRGSHRRCEACNYFTSFAGLASAFAALTSAFEASGASTSVASPETCSLYAGSSRPVARSSLLPFSLPSSSIAFSGLL